MAYNGSNAWYVSSVAYTAVAQFAASTAYTAGQLIRQLTAPAVGSERVFVCIVAGTSGAEPTWTVTKGAKNTSTTPVFQECTGEPGVNGDISAASCMQWTVSSTPPLGAVIYVPSNGSLQICSTSGAGGTGSIPAFSATAGVTTADASATWTSLGAASAFASWKAPHARLSSAFAVNWGSNSNITNDFYLADNHAESSASNINLASPGSTNLAPYRVMSVDHTLSLPPTAVSLKAGASITTSAGSISIAAAASQAAVYYYGVTFGGNGAGSTTIGIANQAGVSLRFESCAFQFITTPNSLVTLSSSGAGPSNIDLVNCTFSFSAAGQRISLGFATVTWKNTAAAILGAVAPTNLIVLVSSAIGWMIIEGVDLSGATNTVVNTGGGGGYVCLKDCKLASAAAVVSAATATSQNTVVDLMRCDSGGTNTRNERHTAYGDETTSTIVARTGGASDGTTPVSHRIAPTAFPKTSFPFTAIPVVIWNATTGTNRRVSLYGVSNAAALPTNADFWFDVEYLGSASSPQGSFVSGAPATQLTAAGAFAVADASAWDSAATARQNSHAYAVGNTIKLASNPGRIFFCTASSGNSAASEPGGYATAVDGGSVTDGSCTFRAGVRFAATLTLSSPQPAQAGYITVYPKLGTNVAAAIHIDPLIVLG